MNNRREYFKIIIIIIIIIIMCAMNFVMFKDCCWFEVTYPVMERRRRLENLKCNILLA